VDHDRKVLPDKVVSVLWVHGFRTAGHFSWLYTPSNHSQSVASLGRWRYLLGPGARRQYSFGPDAGSRKRLFCLRSLVLVLSRLAAERLGPVVGTVRPESSSSRQVGSRGRDRPF
jgi:hypothetical protein